MKAHQLERANGFIREELSLLLGSAVADPRVRALVVTDVNLTADRRIARVYVSCYDEDIDLEEAMRGLESASPFLRRELAQVLGWRFTPELIFRVDRSLQRGARLDKLFKQLEAEQTDQATDGSKTEDDDRPADN